MNFVEANGARIPLIGLGTWELNGRVCVRMVEEALSLGYRHIDTAAMYENEREVGEGLRASGVSRNDLFITTKVWTSDFAPRDLERSAKNSLSKLKLEELDLLLLHWPSTSVPLADTIGALCKVKCEGLTRHIGISNFTIPLIQQAVKLSSEPLVCNQFECHPFLDQTKLIAATKEHGMAVVAYAPTAKGKSKNDPVLVRIGKAHGKSAVQVCLRWLVQQDIAAIPRTSKPDRLKENIGVFDFTLSDIEMQEISALAGRKERLVDWSGSPQWD
jgi:2,5-diketo-D-gluconate reductase B